MKLKDIQCRQAKPKEKQYKMADGGGLYLLVKPNGNKHWRLKYRIGGKEKLLAIGAYPLFSLADARQARDDAKRLIANGEDPVIHKNKAKQTVIRDAKNTFQVIAMEWYEDRKDIWKPRYAQEVLKRLEEDIFPHIGKFPIKDINRPLILEVIRKIEKRGAVDLAKRQLQKCGEIFRYAIASGRLDDDPTYKMSEALKPVKTQHFSSIEVEELPQFVADLNANKGRLYTTTQNALRLMLLTFVRTNELINAKWDEIDFERKR